VLFSEMMLETRAMMLPMRKRTPRIWQGVDKTSDDSLKIDITSRVS
jgi:hypothetical protein